MFAQVKRDTRTQYPAFLINSYFSINLGDIRYSFSDQQLEPGYEAAAIGIPHLAARVGLFGHQFFKYLSAQACPSPKPGWHCSALPRSLRSR